MMMGCDGGASVVQRRRLCSCYVSVVLTSYEFALLGMYEYFNHLSEKHNNNYLLPFIKATHKNVCPQLCSIALSTTHPPKRSVRALSDANRIMLVIDDKEDTNLPVQCIYTWLVNLFTDEAIGLWFAYWCTQTSLASIYTPRCWTSTIHTNPPPTTRIHLPLGRRRTLTRIHLFVQHLERTRRHVHLQTLPCVLLLGVSKQYVHALLPPPSPHQHPPTRSLRRQVDKVQNESAVTVHDDHWKAGETGDEQRVVLR